MVLQLSQTWRGRESPGGTRSASLAPQFEQKFIGGKGMLAPMIHNGARDGRSAHSGYAPPVLGSVRADGGGSLPLAAPLLPFSEFLYRVAGLCSRACCPGGDWISTVPARHARARNVPRLVRVYRRAGPSSSARRGGLSAAKRNG